MKLFATLLLTAAAGAFAAGCAGAADDDGAKEPTMRQRQDQALQDPFGYGPQLPQEQGQKYRPVSDSDALGDDLKRLLNP